MPLLKKIYQLIKVKIALKLGESIVKDKTNTVKILLNNNDIETITIIISPNSKFSKTIYKINNGDVMIFTGQLFFDNTKDIYNQFKYKLDYKNQKDMEMVANYAMDNFTFRQALMDILFNKNATTNSSGKD